MLWIRCILLLTTALGFACLGSAADEKPASPREEGTNNKAKPATLLGTMSPVCITPVPVQTIVALKIAALGPSPGSHPSSLIPHPSSNVAAPWPVPGSEIPGPLTYLYNVSGTRSYLGYLARVTPKAEPEGSASKSDSKVSDREQRREPDRERSHMGEFHCLVTEYGLDPTVMVFVRDFSSLENQAILSLLQKLDQAVTDARKNRRTLHAFVVLLDPTLRDVVKEDVPRFRLQKKVEDLVTDEKNKLTQGNNVIFTISSLNYLKDYPLEEAAAVTIVFYKAQRVMQSNTFEKDKLTEDGVAKPLSEGLAKLLPPK